MLYSGNMKSNQGDVQWKKVAEHNHLNKYVDNNTLPNIK